MERETEIEMKTEIRMIFVTNARQTKESKIVATAKPKII